MIEGVSEFQSLGVGPMSDLSWSTHIAKVQTKSKSYFNALQKNRNTLRYAHV